MIGNLDITTLQQLWWLLCSVVGSLFLFLLHARTHLVGRRPTRRRTFGNTILHSLRDKLVGKGTREYSPVCGSIGNVKNDVSNLKGNRIISVHLPHPNPDVKRYAIRYIIEQLQREGDL